MKKLLKLLLNNKILIVILLIIAIGLPTAIFKKAQGDETTIVVAVGIDREDDKISISIQSANSLIKPTNTMAALEQQSGSQSKLEVISQTGFSVADAISKLEDKTGKNLGFEHCHLIVLSDSIASENCVNILDYFYRKANINLAAYLVSTDESAKTILEKTSDAENVSSSKLQSNLVFNTNNYTTSNLSTIGKFFNDYFSSSKTSTMAFFKSKNISSEQEKSKINNEGESAIFYNGKKVDVIDESLTKGLNFVNLESVEGKMVLNSVSDENVFSNATVTVKIDEGKIKKSISLEENDFLTINLDVTLKIEVLEINQSDEKLSLNLGVENFLTDGLKEKIRQQVQNEVLAIHTYSKEKLVDVCGFLNLLYAFNNSGFKKLTNNSSMENILQKTNIVCKVDVNSYR